MNISRLRQGDHEDAARVGDGSAWLEAPGISR